MTTRVLRAVLAATLLAATVAPTSVFAQDLEFGEPTAQAVIGEPISLSSTITGADIASVDVVLRLDEHETSVIVEAAPGATPGTWQVQQEIDVATAALCACVFEAPSSPNTRFEYQFRAHLNDGTVVVGPVANAVVLDDRFNWQTLEQDLVRVHWYAGDEAFATGVAQTANEAIDRAAELLGATLPEPADLFVYDTQQALVEAVSPNRENIAGQANSSIDTMFVHIPADQSAGEFAGEIIRHELTHLVFAEATDNPYHGPPRWLDEGVAVYLSVGYTPYWRGPVDAAVADGSLIPLPGLRGLFPSTADGFFLGYGESVAAVDFFVETHGEQQLWELVRSYSEGLSDDEAFQRSTGGTVDDFNRAWFQSLGLEPPGPAGPQPGPPGREPADWEGNAPSTAAPSVAPGSSTSATTPPAATGRPAATPAPTPAATPGEPVPSPASADLTGTLVLVGLLVVLIVGGAIALVVARQYMRAERPPGPPPGQPPF
jgi:hypothetical protein